ncbi:DUF4262 domain-containing protein [Streptomyces rubellomurinus]|uniref:DUF4262 domain-containing protein n=1 Tax=Streptomyces rubellomurinus (strain ATCC 31215) TaxID=359131 RepID=A0A0F2TFA8_STRR3|nr:DUF4262 domain-containing protein [Streptomyces rubellomurinus]KJS61839.1 hypothetical protein VM95_12660 [Streptomyces rubellomurinus]
MTDETTTTTASPPCPCVLCDPAASATVLARARLRRRWATRTAHVREYGWHVVGVGGGGEVPDWAFTVGLWHSFRLPEVVMAGLELQGMMHWLNDAAALLRDGAPTAPGTLLPDVIEGYRLRIEPVDPSWHGPLFGTCRSPTTPRAPGPRRPPGYRPPHSPASNAFSGVGLPVALEAAALALVALPGRPQTSPVTRPRRRRGPVARRIRAAGAAR